MRETGAGARIGGIAAVLFLLVAAPLAVAPPQAWASDASNGLVARGLVDLKGGRFVAAAKYFNGAVQLDGKDPRALFYLGVALNRLGQHGAALEAFQRMWDLRVTHRELGLEGGWAAIAQGRTALAIELLEPYVKANPDSAKAREFLGRAYIGDGRLDAAEAELRRAIALDPTLSPTALYYLGNIAAIRNDRDGVATALAGILQTAPDSRTGSVLRDTLRRAAETAPRPKRKPWFASASLSAGRTRNVIGLPDGSVLPSDVSAKDSNLTRAQFDAGYSWRLDPASTLTAGYGLAQEHYTDLSSFDSTSHTVYADVRRRFAESVEGGLRLSHNLSLTGGQTSVQRTAAAPSATWRWAANDATTIGYSFARADFTSDPARRALDRDANIHVFSLSHSTLIDSKVLPIGVNAQVGINRTLNRANGDDFQYNGAGWFFSLSRTLYWDIRGSLSVSHSIDDYEQLNSLAGAGFAFQREDKINRFNVYLERPLDLPDVGAVSVFANWQYVDNWSNIPVFTYTQTTFNVGVVARF